MTRRTELAAWALLAALAVTRGAAAEPRRTIWVEDVHLQPPSTMEVSLLYEFHGTDFKALEEGSDLLALRLITGLADRFDLSPQVRFRQRGDEGVRLHDLGGQLRVRLFDDAQHPHLVVYGGYFNEQSAEHDHRLQTGLAGHLGYRRVFLDWDMRLGAAFGGTRGAGGEIWVGGALGGALLSRGELVVALETFVIQPLGGERISDPGFGEAASAQAVYYGPTVTLRMGSLWTGLSATTGFPVSEPASELMVRWMFGVTR